LKGNFNQSTSVDFNIPFDTLLQILLIVITAVVGWMIPSIISSISNIRQRPSLINYVTQINNRKNKETLEELKKTIIDSYSRGKLNQSNFDLLNNRIGELFSEYNSK
jgi:hypothetical protein